jgi:hypothetical protein
MPKSNSEQMLSCIATLTPTQALALRDLGIDLEFRCPNPDCNQLVKPVRKGKDKDGVTYKAHFEHVARNPKCRFGMGANRWGAVEKHLREAQIEKIEPILAGTAYFGRAEGEFYNAMENEKDPNRRKEMRRRYEELAEKLKNVNTEERELALLDEIEKWKRNPQLSSRV